MIFDNSLLLSDAQAVTASAASANVIDLGTTGTPFGANAPLIRDLGRGQELDLAVTVTQAFAGLTNLQVGVQVSPDNATWTTVSCGAVVPLASLVAGYQFKVPGSIEEGVNARYLRLYYTVGGSNATAGKITAAVVASRQTNLGVGGQ
ncbi:MULTISPECIES: Bbp16 family capsid cement protein [unclassified Novosphingobium]|uniref:Bbp16 family capsid cement protein n=1 Tax=unclassified Novosphingobium TaxID=2644732 RepID=UPI000D3135D2|nr:MULTISPECIES: hypothetical protein [unclassified Novosphingobium]PTR06973.1 hypothetical protein C8K11_11725 [Novosphingobium sp. GV055]PUA99875.1 hypothetical protein C8K12_11768 [Novosphingobium sp. GV061]PUB14715.1 hypothetical protein C8K14_11725 [Novosphingobium sp. GV079]PUB38939.1 hypothetical protein C8K10_11768 [Novosphingobium sp. GV027]